MSGSIRTATISMRQPYPSGLSEEKWAQIASLAPPNRSKVAGGYDRDGAHICVWVNTDLTLDVVRGPTDAQTQEVLSK